MLFLSWWENINLLEICAFLKVALEVLLQHALLTPTKVKMAKRSRPSFRWKGTWAGFITMAFLSLQSYKALLSKFDREEYVDSSKQ